MKKIITIIVLFITSFVLIGCDNTDPDEQNELRGGIHNNTLEEEIRDEELLEEEVLEENNLGG